MDMFICDLAYDLDWKHNTIVISIVEFFNALLQELRGLNHSWLSEFISFKREIFLKESQKIDEKIMIAAVTVAAKKLVIGLQRLLASFLMIRDRSN